MNMLREMGSEFDKLYLYKHFYQQYFKTILAKYSTKDMTAHTVSSIFLFVTF